MTDNYYWCAECSKPIEGDDIDARHSTPDGEDCHAGCCPTCEIEKKYLSDPSQCPVCSSYSLTVQGDQHEDHGYYATLSCDDCGAEWTENYNLTGITIHKGRQYS